MRDKVAITSLDRLVAELAAAQHGVVAHRQLLALGLSRAAIHRRVRAGRLHRIHQGVYAVGHRAISRNGRWMAAVLACGEDAVLSHADAAAAWGIRPSNAAVIHVTVAGGGGRARRAGLRIHRSDLDAADVTVVDGIRVTGAERTLLDLAEIVPRRALERAVDEAEVQRLVDWDRVRRTIARYGARPGAARLLAVLEQHAVASTVTRSELEERVLALCDRHGLPRPAVNARIGPYEVDFSWPGPRLVVEADGHRHHGTRSAFERDRVRDAELATLGWRVIRVTHRRLATREPDVARVLRGLLLQ